MASVLHLVHLYAQELNIYGDTGNRLVLQRRLEWRGLPVKMTIVGAGEKLPLDTDIIIAGGGQDAVQSSIQADFIKKGPQLKQMTADGVAMLLVCGSYQLFGRRFTTHTGEIIKGIDVLPLETTAGPQRLIGNTVYKTPFGHIVGYENHSGLTVLDDKTMALGAAMKGAGNNGHDKTEGCLLNNVFGTYSHGPVLAKNPALADELIGRAQERKFGHRDLKPLDDSFEVAAANLARRRPR